MYQYEGLEDTIVAISTPAGQGGIGIVRLSGKEALSIADRMFMAKSQQKLVDCQSFTTHYGWIMESEDSPIDEVLVTVMRSPKSYTKEDVVEINCHGAMVSLRAIVDLAHSQGARLAHPGEFTKRAFLNGRIDLAQAEAVLDIIQSKTDAFLKVSTNQLKGELSNQLAVIRELLMEVYVEIEAAVNFPEDEIDAKGYDKLKQEVETARSKVEKLLQSADEGRILKEGIKIVLCGKPNVGKSSLLNVLLKTERAIVSEIAGTTRDTIEETAQIKGIPFQLVDTAGVLEPRDLIEEEAIRRSHLYMQSADLVLLLLDASAPIDREDQALIEKLKDQHLIVILNKSDLPAITTPNIVRELMEDKPACEVSVLERTGVDQLETLIIREVLHGKQISAHAVLVSNIRHINSLKSCLSVLLSAHGHLGEGLSLEFISEEIKSGVNYLDSITGKNIDHDLLETIFSQFCIGK